MMQLLDDIENPLHKNFLHETVLRLLMYVRDLHWYTNSTRWARYVAEMMRILEPAKYEAHIRVELTTGEYSSRRLHNAVIKILCVPGQPRHKDIALRGRSGAALFNAVTQGGRKSLSKSSSTDDAGEKQRGVLLTELFVDAAWMVVNVGVEEASRKVDDGELWTQFRRLWSERDENGCTAAYGEIDDLRAIVDKWIHGMETSTIYKKRKHCRTDHTFIF